MIYFMKMSLLTAITEVVWPWQVTNYSKMFEIGSLRLQIRKL